MLLTTPQYEYKSKAEKVYNFFSKLFFNRNLKKIAHDKIIAKRIQNLQDKYALIFIIRPDLLSNDVLLLLKSKTSNFIAYYWNSMAFFPRKKSILAFFDKVYSFDVADCKDYGLMFLSNF